MATNVNLSEDAARYCQQQFDDMMDSCEGIYGVLMSTVDGHDVARHFKRDMPASKLAAMTSSMLALGETVAREAKQQACRFVIVENSDGYVLTLRLGAKLVLTTIAGTGTNLGMLHSVSRLAVERIAAQLTQS